MADGIKKLQQDWIGRSTGAEVDFYVGDPDHFAAGSRQRRIGFPRVPWQRFALRVYTTRPDTLFGATYMVVSPEHPLVDQLTTDEQKQRSNSIVKKHRSRATANGPKVTK